MSRKLKCEWTVEMAYDLSRKGIFPDSIKDKQELYNLHCSYIDADIVAHKNGTLIWGKWSDAANDWVPIDPNISIFELEENRAGYKKSLNL